MEELSEAFKKLVEILDSEREDRKKAESEIRRLEASNKDCDDMIKRLQESIKDLKSKVSELIEKTKVVEPIGGKS